MGGNLKDLGVQYWLPVKEKEKLLVKSSWAPITLNTFKNPSPNSVRVQYIMQLASSPSFPKSMWTYTSSSSMCLNGRAKGNSLAV